MALVRLGGDTIRLTGPSFSGFLSTTPGAVTRSTGSWIDDGFAIGQQVILGGGLSGVFEISDVTDTMLTVTGVNGSTLGTTGAAVSAAATILPIGAGPGQPYDDYAPLVIYGDTSQDGVWYGGDPHTQSLHNFGPKPMPHIEDATVTISRSSDPGGYTGYIDLVSADGSSSSGDFRSDGFAVGQELALGPATVVALSAAGLVYDTYSTHLIRHTGIWADDGFLVGQQVTIDGIPGTWTVKGFASDPTYGSGTVLELGGPTLTPLPNQTMVVTAISQYIGIVKAITMTRIVLNLAISVADFPSGPLFPVDPGGLETGAVRDLRVLNRVGNSAPFFIFPLANPYLYSGNDVIDAHLLDWSDATDALRPIGLTIYGGPGDDLIIGSQTGDQLAGGSGDDTIMGQRGQDHIYGDSGFNVNLITRELVVAVVGNGPAGYLAAQFRNKDDLVAGADLLYGEGPGSATPAFFNTIGNDDDIIFGDLGIVTQDVTGPRDVTKPVPVTPQKISTTSIGHQSSLLNDKYGVAPLAGTEPVHVSNGVLSVDSKALQNGANDWIYGNVDRDLLVGGVGDDAIDGGVQDDLVFGDNVSIQRTLGDFTSPHFQALTGTLLYGRSDRAPYPAADDSGALLVNGTPQNYRDPNDVPWWAEYDVSNLWHDFDADTGTHWAGSFGNDYIAGNQGNDVILGELGSDTIQGDGSIDYVSPGSPTSGLQRVGAFRAPDGCTGPAGAQVCDFVGPLTIYPSVDRATDGEDYIEGNGGNDLIFGGLGQDDIVGGSSDFFSLTTPVLRPDGSDLLFGGSGTLSGRNDDTTSALSPTGSLAADVHARDADTIIGDNGDIIRIVGVNGSDTAGCSTDDCHLLLNQPARMRYVTFNYDTYDTTMCSGSTCTYSPDGKIVVRGVTLLDYTPGGPDFNPAAFGQPVAGPAYCPPQGADTVGTCSAPLPILPGRNGGPGTAWVTDIGGNDEIHGESGDDTVYGAIGSDVIYGDAQDDDLIGGWGNDWISGGTGQDGVLGDDGRIFTSRNSSTGVAWNGSTWIAACQGGYTSPKNGVYVATENCFSEPLYGVAALVPSDPDTRTSQGFVLNEYIYTPGQVQTATINIAGGLAKAVDETPYNLGPNVDGQGHLVLDLPLFDANNSDDIIFGGWDDDFLHGGAGDDAISGSEAVGDETQGGVLQDNGLLSPTFMPGGYVPLYADDATCAQETDCAIGVVRTDWTRPWNPADILHFGADSNPWHSNHHNASRLGEFLLYDEYDPRRAILFDASGSTWGCDAYTPSGHTCTDSPDVSLYPYQYFLNFDKNDGRDTLSGCISLAPNGTCLAMATRKSDGNDAIFGDLGNDWLVGGTSMNDARPASLPSSIPWSEPKDTLYGGWGNDLLNVDDDLSSGCLSAANNGNCLSYGETWLNDIPDTHPSYEDRAYGGAGLDILIGNTGGDRLIDWVGEFNSYIVPFSPFGIATVSRQVEPQLPEFLYALSASQGADPTRDTDTGSNLTRPGRNGEYEGEMGLITQKDHGYWQQQTGGPTDPQAGNIPGGKRDVLRGADFNNGQMGAFAVDSGVWEVQTGTLAVSAASIGQDAAAVFYVDEYLPVYYEIAASVLATKPTGGWKANAYVMFDYWSPTDFKFAGIDVATNKIVMGHRDAAGWIVDVQASIPGHLKSDTFYSMLIAINGTTVTVQVNGNLAFTHTFPVRMLDGEPVGLNKGLVGMGSDNSRGVFDNVVVQKLPPQLTLDQPADFSAGVSPFAAPADGIWTVGGGRYAGTVSSSANAVDLVDFAALGTTDSGFAFDAYLEVRATIRTAGIAGIAFDGYSATDLKFAAIDVPGQRVVIGHVDPHRGWVVDAAVARSLVAGTDYALDVILKGTTVSISVNGAFALSTSYNAAVVDGSVGLIAHAGTVDASSFRIQTDDPAFSGAAPPPPPPANPSASIEDVSITEGNSGTKTISVTISLSQTSDSVVTVPWSTANGTATAGSDYVAASGTATFNPGETTKVISITISGDTLVEPDETFQVRLGVPSGADLAKGIGTITITNDDAPPSQPTFSLSATDASAAEAGSNTGTFTITRSANLTGTIVVNLTWGGSATFNSDYKVTAAGGTLSADRSTITMAGGIASATITITPIDDTLVEPTESVTLALAAGSGYGTTSPTSGTVSIADNDTASGPSISIGDITVTEGNNGTSTYQLLVTLSAASSSPISVQYAMADGSATAGSDYLATSGTLTFQPGVTQMSITIRIVNDKSKEPTETFTVGLSAPSGGATARQGDGHRDDPRYRQAPHRLGARPGQPGHARSDRAGHRSDAPGRCAGGVACCRGRCRCAGPDRDPDRRPGRNRARRGRRHHHRPRHRCSGLGLVSGPGSRRPGPDGPRVRPAPRGRPSPGL